MNEYYITPSLEAEFEKRAAAELAAITAEDGSDYYTEGHETFDKNAAYEAWLLEKAAEEEVRMEKLAAIDELYDIAAEALVEAENMENSL